MPEAVIVAVQALRATWLRGALTALGVIIGVAALVALTAVSGGAQADVAASLRRLGPNIILLDGEFVTLPDGRQSPTDRTLTPSDLAAVGALPGVDAVAPRQSVEGLSISAGPIQQTPIIFGITPVYQEIHNYSAARGRLLSQADVRSGAEVVVLGPVPARRLFPAGGAFGRRVRILNREFTVVGVAARKGSLGPDNLDNRVFVPLTVAKRVLFGGENVRGADVQVRSASDVPQTMDTIDSLLHDRHRIAEGHADDFSTEDQATIITTAAAATSTFQSLTLALGAISLVVGGIGIMNIMLVSVGERTREIGIRKALGADPGRIQRQFLLEALLLCTAGGLAGVACGIAAARLTAALVGWHVVVTPRSLGVAFASSVGVGLFFGIYPARRASRLAPAVAMRRD